MHIEEKPENQKKSPKDSPSPMHVPENQKNQKNTSPPTPAPATEENPTAPEANSRHPSSLQASLEEEEKEDIDELLAHVVQELRGDHFPATNQAIQGKLQLYFTAFYRQGRWNNRTKPQSRLPELTNAENASLIRFLKVSSDSESFDRRQIQRQLTEIVRAVFSTGWKLNDLLKARTQQAANPRPAPTTFENKTFKQATLTGATTPTPQKPREQPSFTANNKIYTPEETEKLKTLCQKPFPLPTLIKRRKPNELEQMALKGLLTGDICARPVPHFIHQVMDPSNVVRFLSQITRDTEGELVLFLPTTYKLEEDLYHTLRMTADIQSAACRLSLPKPTEDQLPSFFQKIKRSTYNKKLHTLHFFFDTKASAKPFEGLQVPFKSHLLQLHPAIDDQASHIISTGRKQLTPKRYLRRMTYRLRNLDDTVNTGAFLQFLQDKIGQPPIATYPLDPYGAYSPWSKTWEMIFLLEKPIDLLHRISVIQWADKEILIQPLHQGLRSRCAKCGVQGHSNKQCRTQKPSKEHILRATSEEVLQYQQQQWLWDSPEDFITSLLTPSPPQQPSAQPAPTTVIHQTTPQPPPTATPISQPTLQSPAKIPTQIPVVQANASNISSPPSLSTPQKASQSPTSSPANHRIALSNSFSALSDEEEDEENEEDAEDEAMYRADQEEAANSVENEPVDDEQDEVDSAHDEDAESDSDAGTILKKAEEAAATNHFKGTTDDTLATKATKHQGKPPTLLKRQPESPNTPIAIATKKSKLKNATPRQASSTLETHLHQQIKGKLPSSSSLLRAQLQDQLSRYTEAGSINDFLRQTKLTPSTTPALGHCQVIAVASALLQLAPTEAHSNRLNMSIATTAAALRILQLLSFTNDTQWEFHQSNAADLLNRWQQLQPDLSMPHVATTMEQLLREQATFPLQPTQLLPQSLWASSDHLRLTAKALNKPIFLLSEESDGPTAHLLFYPATVNCSDQPSYQGKMRPMDQQQWTSDLIATAKDHLPILLTLKGAHYQPILFFTREISTTKPPPPVFSLEDLVPAFRQRNFERILHAIQADDLSKDSKLELLTILQHPTQRAEELLVFHTEHFPEEITQILLTDVTQLENAIQKLAQTKMVNTNAAQLVVEKYLTALTQPSQDAVNSKASTNTPSDDDYQPSDSDASMDNPDSPANSTDNVHIWNQLQEDTEKRTETQQPSLDDPAGMEELFKRHPGTALFLVRSTPDPIRLLEAVPLPRRTQWMEALHAQAIYSHLKDLESSQQDSTITAWIDKLEKHSSVYTKTYQRAATGKRNWQHCQKHNYWNNPGLNSIHTTTPKQLRRTCMHTSWHRRSRT